MRTLLAWLRHCEKALGRGHEDLKWYDEGRPTVVTRDVFLKEYAWALLVWNRSRKSARTWDDKTGFLDALSVRRLRHSRQPASAFARRFGANPRNHFGRRLAAVFTLGRAVGALTEGEFRTAYFLGSREGKALGQQHAAHLRTLGLYGVGPANAAFIVRNMGGELMKCDRWILAVMKATGVDAGDFERAAHRLGWGLGRVDAVVWSYCEQEVGTTGALKAHLRHTGFPPRWK